VQLLSVYVVVLPTTESNYHQLTYHIAFPSLIVVCELLPFFEVFLFQRILQNLIWVFLVRDDLMVCSKLNN